MNESLNKSNTKKRRNALAEKILLAMIPEADFWNVYIDNMHDTIKDAFKMADAFIKECKE